MINAKTHYIIAVLEDIKVTDIKAYNFQGSFAEYVIVGTASSDRHIPVVMDKLKQALPGMVKGKWNRRDESSWLCLHQDDVIIHVVTSSIRDVYQLDQLYFI